MKAQAAVTPDSGRSSSTKLIAIVCVAQFMVILDVSIVNVALPSIQRGLHFSTADLQWIVNAYTIAFAGFLMLGGRFADLLGRRRVFLTGTGMFALCSLACALAFSQGFMVGARAMQGFAGAMMSPATLSIITSSLPEGPQRNRGVAMWGAMGGLGGASGSLFGGALTQLLGWPAIFAINVPLGLLVIRLGRRALPADVAGSAARHFDLSGAVLITASLTALALGIVRSVALGWGSAGVLVPLLGGIVLLGIFFYVEARVATAPLVPMSVLGISRLRAANFVIALLYAALFPLWYFLTLFLQGVLHFDAMQTGLAFLPMTLAIFAASSLSPRLVAALGSRRLIVIGMLMSAAGLGTLGALSADSGSTALVFAGGMLASIGMGCVLVPTTLAATAGLPGRLAGLGSGLLNTSRLMGGALGLAALSTVAASVSTSGSAAQRMTGGFDAAFLVGAFLCLIAALLAFARLGPSRGVAGTTASAVGSPALKRAVVEEG